MTIIQKDVTGILAAFNEFYPADREARLEWAYQYRSSLRSDVVAYSKDSRYDQYLKDLSNDATASVTYDPDTGDISVSVDLQCLGTVLRFYIKPVESCCAMSFLYGFMLNTKLPQELIDKLMVAAMQSVKSCCMSSNRLIVNMVETSQSIKDPLAVPKVLTEETGLTLNYQPLWKFFQTHAARVNTMLMPNKNTGRIIHHMEVLVDDSFFHKA